jgi:hypothetical protein
MPFLRKMRKIFRSSPVPVLGPTDKLECVLLKKVEKNVVFD